MELKNLVYENFRMIKTLFIGVLLSSLLLLFRVKLTKDIFLLFLVWNLVLALIPFAITLFIYWRPHLFASKFNRLCLTILWLLFLPNAPYILTDFIHLQLSQPRLLFYDGLVISAFAITGCLAGIYSLKLMYNIYQVFYTKVLLQRILILIFFLCGFGIYLGRFLRFNSWDLLTQPKALLLQLTHSMYDPKLWLVTFVFGGLLWLLFRVIEPIRFKAKS